MKIGMLVNNLEVSGGYQKLVIRLAQQLDKKGHDVTVYSPVVDKKNCYPDSISSINVVDIAGGATKSLNARFKELVLKIDPSTEALIIHDELSLIGVACLPKTKIRSIVWMLNNQLPENLGSYKSELMPILKTRYSSRKDKRTDVVNNAKRIRLMKKGLKKVNRFAVYDSVNASLVTKNLGKKADFVAAGADLEQFMPLYKKRNVQSEPIYTVLSVGVLFPHRRYEDVIDAIKLLDDAGVPVKATIVGRQDLSPAYFRKLENKTKKLKLTKKIAFLNYVTDTKMTELYSSSDAFVFINDGFTWGISVFEAVAAGLPVVITDNIGAADLVKHRKTGWVIPANSPPSVAEAIKEIVANPKKTQSVIKRANEELAEFVSWEAYTNRMLKLIEKPGGTRI